MGFTANDLFASFNSDYIGRISGVKAGVNAVLGPPASGKCFLIKSYVGNALETIIGFENLKPVSACEENEVVEDVTKENKASAVDRLANFLVNVFPRAKALMETKTIDAAISELREHGFSDVELSLLRKYFNGINRVPRQLIRQLIKLKVNHGLLIPYSIPWDVDEKYSLSGDVKEAVSLIKKHFSRGIKWLGVNYIPPGLVRDVAGILRDPGRGREEAEKEAGEYVERQAEAYYRIVKLLVGEEVVEFEGFLALGITN
ncbi:MAG: tetratricopeptide repeat protein, partial [Vulcanisaeta sp.]